MAPGAVGRKEVAPQTDIGDLLLVEGPGPQGRLAHLVDDEPGQEHGHEDEAGEVVPVEAALQPLCLELARRRAVTRHSRLLDARRAQTCVEVRMTATTRP